MLKRVLIIGKDSYIGESIYNWLVKDSDFSVDIVSPLNGKWRQAVFSEYDTVIDVAGIAHINNITEDMRNLFYSVNRDLTIEIGEYAKKAGVKHFIFFSSMNVYGEFCNIVSDRNNTNPSNFYGDSKLQGDVGLFALEDDNFKVASIRPPFVYGKGCKGNYNTVSRLAKKLPVFPSYKNCKSMIYIDNLCEFIKLLIRDESRGVFTPQNRELVSTSDLVRAISKYSNHRIWITGIFNWMIPVLMKIFGFAKKAFIDDAYDLSLSDYYNFDYCVVDFETSVKNVESC